VHFIVQRSKITVVVLICQSSGDAVWSWYYLTTCVAQELANRVQEAAKQHDSWIIKNFWFQLNSASCNTIFNVLRHGCLPVVSVVCCQVEVSATD
jgi:hypothetical protein